MTYTDLKNRQNFFLLIFYVSLSMAVLIGTAGIPGNRNSVIPKVGTLILWVEIASSVISFISLLCLIITTTMLWRKDKREVKAFIQENEKRELEIKKLNFEILAMGHDVKTLKPKVRKKEKH
jgi:hypothetical protein